MRKYETIFILDCGIEEETRNGLVERIKSLVEEHKGTVETLDEWGTKKLAYAIVYKKEGYYVFMEFEAEPDFPIELERIYRITEGILKGLIVKKED